MCNTNVWIYNREPVQNFQFVSEFVKEAQLDGRGKYVTWPLGGILFWMVEHLFYRNSSVTNWNDQELLHNWAFPDTDGGY